MVRPSAQGRRNLIVAAPIRHTNRRCPRVSRRRRRRSERSMRVIAGEAHGRRLRVPRGLVTRPATARVRASIFSRLAARTEISGARVLDLRSLTPNPAADTAAQAHSRRIAPGRQRPQPPRRDRRLPRGPRLAGLRAGGRPDRQGPERGPPGLTSGPRTLAFHRANRHLDGYTGRVMEVLTLVCYRFSAAAGEADGVTAERRQAPD